MASRSWDFLNACKMDFWPPGNNGCMLQSLKKRGLDIKNTPGNIKYADALKKRNFYEIFSDLISFNQGIGLFSCFFFFGYIFFRTLIPVILFPVALLIAPIILGKKSPRNLKAQDFISSDILSWDFLPKFLFPGFFFLWLPYIHRFLINSL